MTAETMRQALQTILTEYDKADFGLPLSISDNGNASDFLTWLEKHLRDTLAAIPVESGDTKRLDWLLGHSSEVDFFDRTFPHGRIGSTLEQKRQAIDDAMFFAAKAAGQ